MVRRHICMHSGFQPCWPKASVYGRPAAGGMLRDKYCRVDYVEYIPSGRSEQR